MAKDTDSKEKINFAARIDPALVKRAQQKMIDDGISQQDFMERALREYVEGPAQVNPTSKKMQHHDMQGDEDLAYSLLNFVKNPYIATEFKPLVDAVVSGAKALDKKRKELTDNANIAGK